MKEIETNATSLTEKTQKEFTAEQSKRARENWINVMKKGAIPRVPKTFHSNFIARVDEDKKNGLEGKGSVMFSYDRLGQHQPKYLTIDGKTMGKRNGPDYNNYEMSNELAAALNEDYRNQRGLPVYIHSFLKNYEDWSDDRVNNMKHPELFNIHKYEEDNLEYYYLLVKFHKVVDGISFPLGWNEGVA